MIGHVYTFEFHALRATAARTDFSKIGVSDVVTVTNRDVCKEGFLLEDKGLTPETAGEYTERGGASKSNQSFIDGVFLDLPGPWDAVPHAKLVLKKGSMLCSFSPCIEQVQKCSQVLASAGFVGIHIREERRKISS